MVGAGRKEEACWSISCVPPLPVLYLTGLVSSASMTGSSLGAHPLGEEIGARIRQAPHLRVTPKVSWVQDILPTAPFCFTRVSTASLGAAAMLIMS